MTDPSRTLTVATPEAMAELGARIARELRAGDLVQLDGELGAGKTTLTRSIGEALGVRGAVTSPTFVLARTHPREGGAPLVHVDAYRLSTAMELDDLDIDWPGSIVVVEWGAGKLDGLTDDVLRIAIERRRGAGGIADAAAEASVDGGGSDDPDPDLVEPREVTITRVGPRWADVDL